MGYVGQTRDTQFIAILNTLGVGECTTRGEYPPKRRPWFYDNGAFRDWRAGVSFDEPAFCAEIEALKASGDRPDFLVAPDVVGGGRESLAVSESWADHLKGVAPLGLAVQDGMSAEEVAGAFEPFAVLFVGGTLEWKMATGGAWVRLAHKHGKRCHIGRVGTPSRVFWAKSIGADSIDSSQPLWSRENLAAWLGALTSKRVTLPPLRGQQGSLFA